MAITSQFRFSDGSADCCGDHLKTLCSCINKMKTDKIFLKKYSAVYTPVLSYPVD